VGKAVRRNHLKRRLREFFRLHKPWLPPSTDIVVVAKKGLPNVTYRGVCRDLERFLRDPSHPSARYQRRVKHAKTDPGRGDKAV
jgi:ribonuclease P protein component